MKIQHKLIIKSFGLGTLATVLSFNPPVYAIAPEDIENTMKKFCIPPEGSNCNPNHIAKYTKDGCVCENDPGAIWNPQTRECFKCQAGTYLNKPTDTTCTPCPAGTYNPNRGSTSVSECIPCPPGSYNLDTGNYKCYPCEKGGYCTGGKNHTACPAGTYNPNTSSKSVSECIVCPAGTYSSNIGVTSSSSCKPCPAGSYGNVSGAKSNNACIMCREEDYQPEAGKASCLSCGPGVEFCHNITGKIRSCRKGYYLANEKCNMCPSGYYCPEGATVPTKCPEYYWSNRGWSQCGKIEVKLMYSKYDNPDTGAGQRSCSKWVPITDFEKGVTCGNNLCGDPYYGHKGGCGLGGTWVVTEGDTLKFANDVGFMVSTWSIFSKGSIFSNRTYANDRRTYISFWNVDVSSLDTIIMTDECYAYNCDYPIYVLDNNIFTQSFLGDAVSNGFIRFFT